MKPRRHKWRLERGLKVNSYRCKYYKYWISIEPENEIYKATIWLVGHPGDKQHICFAFSAQLAERCSKREIDRINQRRVG